MIINILNNFNSNKTSLIRDILDKSIINDIMDDNALDDTFKNSMKCKILENLLTIKNL